jgi:hypothetical protein
MSGARLEQRSVVSPRDTSTAFVHDDDFEVVRRPSRARAGQCKAAKTRV